MHQPVMLKEAISSLNLKAGYTVADATVGGGAHAYEIMNRIMPGGRLIGLDADDSVLKIAQERLAPYRDSIRLINENFSNLDPVMKREGVKYLNAILFDLGVSSYQLDSAVRGFSIRHNAKLDMRMDPRISLTAYEIVNRYSEKDLSDIIERYGNERFHNRIARFIVQGRSYKPIETTRDLVGVIHSAVKSRYGRAKIDPATRTFQALRIAVNDELGSLEAGLKQAVSWLGAGARICVISFHSLEDRIVKNLFKGYSHLGILKIVTKKPLTPARDEILQNPRSRSAKLRVAERVWSL